LSCTLYAYIIVALGQNQPLRTAPEVWKTDVPITEGQLKRKRNTFWETAPAYEGRCEIWDALKAACEAVEDDDYTLAQAIIDGANINLPTGEYIHRVEQQYGLSLLHLLAFQVTGMNAIHESMIELERKMPDAISCVAEIAHTVHVSTKPQ